MSTAPEPDDRTEPGERASPAFIEAGKIDDWERGRGRPIELPSANVAVFRTEDDRFVALQDLCPHAGAPLSDGIYRDEHVVCSWHGWRFEPATGVCPHSPWATPVPRYAVEVRDGVVHVATTPTVA